MDLIKKLEMVLGMKLDDPRDSGDHMTALLRSTTGIAFTTFSIFHASEERGWKVGGMEHNLGGGENWDMLMTL
jgi:hypothetical protein